MKKRFTMVAACLLMGMSTVLAQNTKVTGHVVDENGDPVIGASVVVKGTTIGTVTDFDGNFVLEIPEEHKHLEISYVGMEKIMVRVAPQVNVTMESDSQALDEVMVVAYGTTRKASFTGSASVMKAADIAAQKTSLVKSLEGKVAGVRVGGSTGDPGADQKILIRGISSFSASTQPLYVIDGVAMTNDGMSIGLKSQSILASINPDDIESMTILKDAAAASLYGSRAANGVVIITTKKGKEGKTKITYNMESGWTDMAVGSQYNVMNAAQIQQYYNDALKNYAEINPTGANNMSTSSMVLVSFIYSKAFVNWDLGYASAAAICLFLIVLVVTLVQFKNESKFAND